MISTFRKSNDSRVLTLIRPYSRVQLKLKVLWPRILKVLSSFFDNLNDCVEFFFFLNLGLNLLGCSSSKEFAFFLTCWLNFFKAKPKSFRALVLIIVLTNFIQPNCSSSSFIKELISMSILKLESLLSWLKYWSTPRFQHHLRIPKPILNWCSISGEI